MAKKVRKHGKIFSFFKGIFKTFKKKPKIYNLNDENELANEAIYISNHSAASGPMLLSLYFPTFFVPWGAHPMTENYKNRWKYLYYIFYQKKLGYKKVKSFILATLFGLISKRLYVGMRLIPTYEDLRFHKTIKQSMYYLKRQEAILIFPEDSNEGYLETLTKFNPGFVALAKIYLKRENKSLPIYPIYYHKKSNSMIIGKPQDYEDISKQLKTNEEVASHFKDVVNSLGVQLLEMIKID